jgi:6-phosphogluconolactonase
MTSAKTSGAYRVRTGKNPIAVTLSHPRQFVYVANWGAHTISAYRISTATGHLSPVEGSPFASGLWPHAIAATASGEFLYTANGQSNDVSAFRIDLESGALQPVTGSPFRAGPLGSRRLCGKRFLR